MWLTHRINDEIRASFPGEEELEIRLAIRNCWKEDRDPRTVADQIGLTNSQLRALEPLAAWLNSERERLSR